MPGKHHLTLWNRDSRLIGVYQNLIEIERVLHAYYPEWKYGEPSDFEPTTRRVFDAFGNMVARIEGIEHNA